MAGSLSIARKLHDALITAMGTVSIDAGYNFTVKKTSKRVLDIKAAGDDVPATSVLRGPWRVEISDDPTDLHETKCIFGILGYLAADGDAQDDAFLEQLADFEADLREAIVENKDAILAVDPGVKTIEIIDGDPDVIFLEQIGTVYFNIRIGYYHEKDV